MKSCYKFNSIYTSRARRLKWEADAVVGDGSGKWE